MRVQFAGLRLSLAVAVIAGAALLSYGCKGSGGQTAPSPTAPGGSPAAGTPTDTPQPPLDPTGYHFVYGEFGAEADTIWSIKPNDISDRLEVAKIPHKAGWAITPALSPDGEKIAYNVMPEEALSPLDADAYVLDVKSGEAKLVARRVDLLTVPRWSPDGGLLFLRQNAGEDLTVILVDLREPGEGTPAAGEGVLPPLRTVLRQHESDVLAYILLGFDAKTATMYFAQVQGGTENGSFLGRYAPATGEAVATATAIADATATAAAATATPAPTPMPIPDQRLSGDVYLVLSDQIARDYALSPDASLVAFLVPGLVEGQFVARTYLADVQSEEVSPLRAPAGLAVGDQISPAWHPDGKSIAVGQLPSGSEPGRVAVVPIGRGEALFLPPPDKGFDQPLGWSPDGRYLAVASFSGDSLGNPGPSRLVFISMSGQRLALPEGSEIRFAGWAVAE